MTPTMTTIKTALEKVKNPFAVEENKSFKNQTCDLFTARKAGMAGKDFVYIHDLEKLIRMNR